MAISYSRKSRRFKSHSATITQQLITFKLRQEWFALPIKSVQKVFPMGKVYGDPKGTGVSLTIYQDKELLVVDVGHRIFGETPSPNPPETGENAIQRFLLIVQSSQGELIGLPIDSLPALRRVPESAFTPLPEAYISEANIRCVSSLMLQTQEDETPCFLLTPELLIQPQQIVSFQQQASPLLKEVGQKKG